MHVARPQKLACCSAKTLLSLHSTHLQGWYVAVAVTASISAYNSIQFAVPCREMPAARGNYESGRGPQSMENYVVGLLHLVLTTTGLSPTGEGRSPIA